ncbi:hypothetical protein Cpir12675_003292 [Ceratocystis pirilliformis]|uniref:Uncharacterized protein n=1 Tax=Ceratocystis pirilliformis TaxID=259994 RepID=A0ABR3Z5J7_9PEZI
MVKPTAADSPVLDSWEDGSDTEATPSKSPPNPATTQDAHQLEKTTDILAIKPDSAPADDWHRFSTPYSSAPYTSSPATASVSMQRRPEKTDAVARRMIAGALGIKPPKQTEEQRTYHKALLEREKLQRQEAREAKKREQEKVTKAKEAMWKD